MVKSKVFRLFLVLLPLVLLGGVFYSASFRPFIWKQKGAFDLKLSDDGRVLVVQSPGLIRVYDCFWHRVIGDIKFPPKTGGSILEVSSDGSHLACSFRARTGTGNCISIFGVGTTSVSPLYDAALPNGKSSLAVHLIGNNLHVLCNDAIMSYSSTGKLEKQLRLSKVLPIPEVSYWSGAFSPDGKWAVIHGGDNDIAIFDAQNGHYVNSWKFENPLATDFEFSRDNRTLTAWSNHFADSGYDPQQGPPVFFERFYWSLPDGKLIQDWDDTGVLDSSFSPDENAGLREDKGGVWFEELRSPDHRRSNFQIVRPFAGKKAWITALRFSKSGGLMAALNEDGAVWVQKRW